MDYDKNNVFAKILRREIPAHVVEEDEHTLTFMDVMPVKPGHSLVIPKVPAVNLLDVDQATAANVIQQVQRISNAALRAFGTTGVMVMQLNNAGAGQSVFHLHFHVIPNSDGLNFTPHGRSHADPSELNTNAQKLKKALAVIDTE